MTENQVVRTELQVHLGSALDDNKVKMGHSGQKNPVIPTKDTWKLHC